MRKVYNFSAGPAMLPEEVLLQIQEELLDWQGTGMSIMELGHRGPEFKVVAEQTESDLRKLMNIPDNYQVLFTTGGATAQFAMVPINLMGNKGKADYFDTGVWSKKALTEAKRYGDVNIVATASKRQSLSFIPDESEWKLSPDAAYVHYTPNETIEGIAFPDVPGANGVPLVADMTSAILSYPIDVAKYGVIYAGAQKNMGQSGIAFVIIRDDLIQEAPNKTPTLYQYKTYSDTQSMYNTPPTFAWYVSGLVFSWMLKKGGVDYFYQENLRKAEKVYGYIDQYAEYYTPSVDKKYRSMSNAVFTLPTEQLTDQFCKDADTLGLTNLKGHRAVGGVRVSMYNAMPEAGVDSLLNFMEDFRLKHSVKVSA